MDGWGGDTGGEEEEVEKGAVGVEEDTAGGRERGREGSQV